MPWLMGFLVLKYAFHLINGLQAMKVGKKLILSILYRFYLPLPCRVRVVILPKCWSLVRQAPDVPFQTFHCQIWERAVLVQPSESAWLQDFNKVTSEEKSHKYHTIWKKYQKSFVNCLMCCSLSGQGEFIVIAPLEKCKNDTHLTRNGTKRHTKQDLQTKGVKIMSVWAKHIGRRVRVGWNMSNANQLDRHQFSKITMHACPLCVCHHLLS